MTEITGSRTLEDKIIKWITGERYTSGSCFFNNVVWPFTRRGYTELKHILKTNRAETYCLAIIDFDDCITDFDDNITDLEQLKSAGTVSISGIYELSIEAGYEQITEAIKNRFFGSANQNCTCSNALLFTSDLELVWYINQREGCTIFSAQNARGCEPEEMDRTWVKGSGAEQMMQYCRERGF